MVVVLAGVLVVGMVAACGPAADEPAGDGSESGSSSSEETGTAGEGDRPNDADGAVGVPATAGPCELLVTKVERGDGFGRYTAKEGVLLAVYVRVKNVSDVGLNLVASDFQLTDGESYTTALTEDPEMTPTGMVIPGESKEVTAVFHVPAFLQDRPMTFVYQSIASGEAVHIEVPLQ
jgi:hypothetical protein